MAYDSGEHGVAQRYLTQVLAYARHAGDYSLGVEILLAQAHQALYLALATLLTECLACSTHPVLGRSPAWNRRTVQPDVPPVYLQWTSHVPGCVGASPLAAQSCRYHAV